MTPQRHILHVFPSFAAGGAQMRMAALANHFGRRFTHSIIALDGDIACRDRLDPGLAVSFPPPPAMAVPLPVRLRRIAASLRTIRPDLLITSNWGAIEWAIANRLLVGTGHLHTEDGFGRDERDRQLPRRVLTRRLVLRFSTTIVPSRTLLDTATRIWRLKPSRVHYIPNGIDLTRFAPAAVPPSPSVLLPAVPSPPVIGCVAALRPEKNLSRLIRAAALVQPARPFTLVVLGDGPERAALEAQAAQAGLIVHFLGACRDPAPLYRDFTIFALTSDTEQMPLSVMEAMASGLPVVATDVGDIRRMIAPENLPFLTGRDDRALADAMARLLDDPGAARAIGHANRLCAEQHFGFATMAARWAQLLQ